MSTHTIPCRICSKPTYMIETKLCMRCWELETRVKADPELTRRILATLEEDEIERGRR